MGERRTHEIWILGATGRTGRALAQRLAHRGLPGIVLVGRSPEGLHRVADGLDADVRVLALDGFEAMATAVRSARPAVVANLLGSYAASAPVLARACMPGGAYVDLANDLGALEALLGQDGEARRSESTLISGAGFGVLGTEALIGHLCSGRPVPDWIQVDALASFATENGVMGEAFAQTSVDVMATGGRAYRSGLLVPVRLASHLRRHTLPDGSTASSAAVPSGELLAARLISGAPNVDFTSGLAPTATVVRAVLPVLTRLVGIPVPRRLLVRQLASSTTKAAPRPRPHSWGHAVVTWPDGSTREGWMRADDAMDFTADALAVAIGALASGSVPHGAFTPAAALGPQAAVDAGGTFIDV